MTRISIILCILMVFIVPYFTESLQSPSTQSFNTDNKAFNKKSTILVWTKPRLPRLQSTYLLDGLERLYDSCFVTTHRGELSKADAVIFTLNDFDCDDLPQEDRNPNQLWILFSIDSVIDNFRMNIADFGSEKIEFNLTVSYSPESDITIVNTPGGLIRKKKFSNNNNSNDIDSNMTLTNGSEQNRKSDNMNSSQNVTIPKAITENGEVKPFRVSYMNACENDDWRETYVRSLSRWMTINRIGTSDQFACYERRVREVIKDLSADTYFLMLFPLNPNATVNIILDLWEVLSSDIIPVVYGKSNFADFLPPNSYINATNLTAQELGNEMNSVLIIDDKYPQYFHWRFDYEPLDPKKVEPSYQLFTGICSAIHKREITTKLNLINDQNRQSKTIEDFQRELLSTQGKQDRSGI